MAEVFVIVDDRPARKTTLAYNLKKTITTLTSGAYTAELLEGVLIAGALKRVRDCVEGVVEKGSNTVAGILVDLRETGNQYAGAELLCQIKKDPVLTIIPVVIYTSKYVDLKRDEWIREGARDVIQRDVTSGKEAHVQLARQVLSAFGVELDT